MNKEKRVRLLISSPGSNADLRFLCGAEPPETSLFIQTGNGGTLIVSEMEFNRLRRSVKRGIRVVYPDLIGSEWKKGMADWIRHATDVRRVSVPESFPAGLVEKLKKEGFCVEISAEEICPQRELKTADEVRCIRKSQKAAVIAMQTAVRQIAAARIGNGGFLFEGKQKLTAEQVRATIGHCLLDLECHATETIVACGEQAADPHERGHGPLRAGEPIVLDIFPRSAKTGYWGDITRTVCRGPASVELKKMYNAVKAAQLAALCAVKEGVRADAVHKTAADEMEKRGYQTEAVDGRPQGFIHGTGHGVGLEIHEAPRVSPANHQKLKDGMIITIEPGLYYPGIGGIRIEDTVLVTKTGFQMLASCPKRFEI